MNENSVVIYSPSVESCFKPVLISPFYESQLNCLIADILQNIFFCVQEKKEIHTGLKQLEGE